MIYQLFSKYYLSNLNPDISYEFFISDINNLKKGGINMSSPSAPYYYKTDSDTSHWETSCSKNHYKPNSSNWVKIYTKPSAKEQCNECKAKLVIKND